MSNDKVFKNYNSNHLKLIRNYPHYLGLIAGKDKLSLLHSRWILYIWDTVENRALQAHRGSYKTTALIAIGVIWHLLSHPNDRVLILRKVFTDAMNILKSIELIMKMPQIRELFFFAHGEYPDFRICRAGKLEFTFKKTNTPEGSIEARGFDFGLTGSHYDRIIADDFITLKDRISKAEREKTKEVQKEINTNIVDPGKPVSYIGTPWHRNDGWSLDGMPFIQKWNVSKCGILTPQEVKKKKATTTPVLYSANYELRHDNDADMLFKDPTYDSWKFTHTNVYGHLDCAYDGGHYNALTFMAWKPNGRIQAVGFTYPGNVKDWLDFIKKKYRKYKCKKIYNETNPDKGYTADRLRKQKLLTSTYHEDRNKHHKISTYLYEVWHLIDWDPETDDDYMEQIIDYREGEEPDDAGDSASSLISFKFSDKKSHNTQNLYK